MYAGADHTKQLTMFLVIIAFLGISLGCKQYAYIIIITGILSFPSSWILNKDFLDRHYSDADITIQANLTKEIAQKVALDPDAENKWDNTIACYGSFNRDSMRLPAGAGLQFMTHNYAIPAKYAAVNYPSDSPAIIGSLMEDGYVLIVDQENLAIYERQS